MPRSSLLSSIRKFIRRAARKLKTAAGPAPSVSASKRAGNARAFDWLQGSLRPGGGRRASATAPNQGQAAFTDADIRQITELSVINCEDSDVVKQINQNISLSLAFADNAQKIAASHTPSLIVTHDTFALWAGHRIAKNKGIPMIADLVEITELGERSGHLIRDLPEKVRRAIETRDRQCILDAERCYTVSNSLRANLEAKYGRDIGLLRNFRSDATPQMSDAIRRRTGCNSSDILLAYVNTIYGEYGAFECMDALRYLPENYKLVYIGRFALKEEKERIKQKATDEFPKRVYFFDPLPSKEYLSLLSGCDIGLSAYRTDRKNIQFSLGNRISDYITAEVPIISSDLTDPREIIESFDIGAVLREVSGEEIANCVQQVAERDKTELKENLRKARKHLNWTTEAAQFKKDATRLVGGKPEGKQAFILARKMIELNNRILRQARTLSELGLEVHILAYSTFNEKVARDLPANVHCHKIPRR